MSKRVGDFVSVRSFPAVVQSADVRELRDNPDEATRDDFCGGYLGYDDRSRYALETALASLVAARGGAFFFNGVFGSGKSHLLGLLALLCDGLGWNSFAESHPHLAPLRERFAPRLVVYFSLDDWAASNHSLEEVFWREVRREWQRRFTETLPIAPDGEIPTGARGETWADFEELLAARELSGCAIFIDELSLFLGGREHHLLQRDAAWLQFIGQRAHRSHTRPVWFFGALQKTVEDIGDVDAYAVSQIRDRFTTLPLALAHLPSLIERRLIQRHDADKLTRFNDETYAALSRALPRLDFGREEWNRLYPFHPATVALLEQIAPRYFSRTRSAVLFLSNAMNPNQDAGHRVLPPQLFDSFEAELPLHPDLKPVATAWEQWQNEEKELARDATEAEHLRAVWKTLALWKIAGHAPTIAQVVNALALDVKLPADGSYEYGRILLERLRAHAPVALERREGPFTDRYSLDFGTRIAELARRFTANALANLGPQDGRVTRYALRCSRDGALPLATLDGTLAPTMWRNAPRQVQLSVVASTPAPEVLANRVAALPSAGGPDALLFLVPPFGEKTESDLWRAAFREAFAQSNVESRWHGAVVWWLPRTPSDDETQQAREATAHHSLLSDPQLSDNRRGRAVLEHLRASLEEREAALGKIGVRLLLEGTLFSGAGAVIDGGELAAGNSNWNATIEALAEWIFPTVFPRWLDIAPRARVLSEGSAQTLGLEILRRPSDAPFFAPSHERLVRSLAEPLGIARAEAGRWKISGPKPELRDYLLQAIGQSTTLAALEAQTTKSAWGLAPELLRLCVCALLRTGELAASDARGQSVAANEIGFPLARSIRTLAPGQLLDETTWDAARESTVLLANADIGARSFASQENARALLAVARDDWRAAAELQSARLHQLRRALGGDWTECEAAQESLARVIYALDGDALNAAATLDTTELQAVLDEWRTWQQALEAHAADLVEARLFLSHPQMVSPHELRDTREELLAQLARGEVALRDDALLPSFSAWREEYGRIYTDWHQTQHDAARWNSLRRLISGDALRALEQLGLLQNREFPFAQETRALLIEELAKQCPRDGTIGREPVCASCRMRLGERIVVHVETIEAQFGAALQMLRTTLGDATITASLRRNAGAALLEWRDGLEDKSPVEAVATLLPVLDSEALRAFDNALRPRRRVTRSFATLQQTLTKATTRAEAESAFVLWLDGGESFAREDEIIWES
ncbi:MAG TPA: DUF6079 family protein [Abditibacteriaceae bacterium]